MNSRKSGEMRIDEEQLKNKEKQVNYDQTREKMRNKVRKSELPSPR